MAPKFPKTIGACIDLMYKMREERQAAQKLVDEAQAKECELKEHILNTFNKDDVEGARGKLATASVTRRTVAQVENWDDLYGYIAKHKAFDLLQKRVSDTAYRERLEQNDVVPGVNPYVVISLNLSKSSK